MSNNLDSALMYTPRLWKPKALAESFRELAEEIEGTRTPKGLSPDEYKKFAEQFLYNVSYEGSWAQGQEFVIKIDRFRQEPVESVAAREKEIDNDTKRVESEISSQLENVLSKLGGYQTGPAIGEPYIKIDKK